MASTVIPISFEVVQQLDLVRWAARQRSVHWRTISNHVGWNCVCISGSIVKRKFVQSIPVAVPHSQRHGMQIVKWCLSCISMSIDISVGWNCIRKLPHIFPFSGDCCSPCCCTLIRADPSDGLPSFPLQLEPLKWVRGVKVLLFDAHPFLGGAFCE